MLIIDCNNIAFREAFARPNLSHNDRATGMIYGFLQQLMILTGKFDLPPALCWDSISSLRKEFHAGYKANRTEKDPGHLAQLTVLRTEILPRIGHHCHHLDGYEADDLIAVLVQRPGNHVIVSSDSDLYQLLNDRVTIYDPGKKSSMTEYWFTEEQYDIEPSQWPMVKAIAGDTSDNVIGVPGVGIKTAIKHLRGQATAKVNARIEAHAEVITRNLKLVTLPWEGCEPGPTPVSRFDAGEFELVCREYGLYSLLR